MKISKTTVLILLLCSSQAFADTKNMQIEIKADSMELHLNTGSNKFLGNVTIQRGAIILSGDSVTLVNKSNKLEQIEVIGSPATYEQESDESTVTASSNKMEYLNQQNTLTLIENARLVQPNSTIESDRIVYDTSKKVIVGGNNQGSDERVNIKLKTEN